MEILNQRELAFVKIALLNYIKNVINPIKYQKGGNTMTKETTDIILAIYSYLPVEVLIAL